jgi:hypothetical protein
LSKSKQEPIIVESDSVEKDVSGPPRRFQVGSSRSVKSTENTSATSASPTARGDSLRLPDEPTTGSDSGSRIFQEWTRNRRSKMGKDGSQDDWRQQDSLTPRQDTLESWGEDGDPASPSCMLIVHSPTFSSRTSIIFSAYSYACRTSSNPSSVLKDWRGSGQRGSRSTSQRR